MANSSETESGHVIRISNNSCDFYSRNYTGTLARRGLACWYDVHPYSLTLWPHHFSENLRRGAWWIKKLNYAYIAVELLLDGEVIYEQDGQKDLLCHPGEIYLTSPGSNLRFCNGSSRYARQLQLIISGGTIKLLLESLGMGSGGVIRPGEPRLHSRPVFAGSGRCCARKSREPRRKTRLPDSNCSPRWPRRSAVRNVRNCRRCSPAR